MAATFSWLIGYAASWASKWLLTDLFVDGVFLQILDVVNYRLGGSFRGEEFGTAETVWTSLLRSFIKPKLLSLLSLCL